MKRFLYGIVCFTSSMLLLTGATDWRQVELLYGTNWVQVAAPDLLAGSPRSAISAPNVIDPRQIYAVQVHGRPANFGYQATIGFVNEVGLLVGGKYIVSAPAGSPMANWYRVDRVEAPSYNPVSPLSYVSSPGPGGDVRWVVNSNAPTPLSFFGKSLTQPIEYDFSTVDLTSVEDIGPYPSDASNAKGPMALIQTVWRLGAMHVITGEDTYVALSSVNPAGGYSNYETAINRMSFSQNRVYYDPDPANQSKPRWNGTPGTFGSSWHPRYIFAVQVADTPTPGHGFLDMDVAVSVYVGPSNDPLSGTLNVSPTSITPTPSNKTVTLSGEAYDNLPDGNPRIELEITDSSGIIIASTEKPGTRGVPLAQPTISDNAWSLSLDTLETKGTGGSSVWTAGTYTVHGYIADDGYGLKYPQIGSPKTFTIVSAPCSTQTLKIDSSGGTGQTPPGPNPSITLTVNTGTTVRFTASGGQVGQYTWKGVNGSWDGTAANPSTSTVTVSPATASDTRSVVFNNSTGADVTRVVKVSAPAGTVGTTSYCASSEATATVTVKPDGAGVSTFTIRAQAKAKPGYEVWFSDSEVVEQTIILRP